MNRITDEISFKMICIMSACYAVFYTFCLYHNNMGLTFPVFVMGTIVFFLYYMKLRKKPVSRFSIFYMGAICLLGTDICITANRTLIIFDKVFIFVLFFMMFLHNLYDDKTWDVSRYVSGIVKYVLSALGYIFRPFYDLADYLKRSKEDQDGVNVKDPSVSSGRTNILYVMIGLAISVPLLCVILPLLLSSDIIFSNKMEDMFSFVFDLDITLPIMIICIFFAAYAMLYRLTESLKDLEEPVTDKRTLSPVIAITVNTVLLTVYLMYSIIQVIYLFMRKGTLPNGYTYTRYAHEGFFQLVFVCLINIVLVLLCRKYSKDSKVLKVILCMISGCTYIMISSSAYRMYLYIDAYKLTFLRIYVLWALLVMAVIMAGIIVYLYKPDMKFVNYCVVSFISLWIMFVAIDPDYQIAKYNIQYHDDDDYICELSLDALPAIERYGDEELIDKYFLYRSRSVNGYERKKIKNEKLTVRTWNYSKWRAKEIWSD